MDTEIKERFKTIMKYVDLINPYIVLLSIVGLVFEYTVLKDTFININKVFDILFVIDFLIRSISIPFRMYFFRGYGWVDFLAAIPGFLILIDAGGVLSLMKVVRIGRFFKIIRILRVLRIFSFLKKMKSDSTFIQERLMKTGTSIVLTLIVAISLVDYMLMENLIDNRTREMKLLSKKAPSELEQYKYMYAKIDGKNIIPINADKIMYKTKDELLQSNHNLIDIELDGKEYIVNFHDIILKQHDPILLTLVLALICLLFIILFYIGFIFAKDMRVVHLIIDSIDAEEYVLLNEEVRRVEETDGSIDIVDGEDEIRSLLKMTGKLIRQLDKTQGDVNMVSGLDSDFNADFPQLDDNMKI